jgi:L-histidine N-alpha-methyltransferase
MKNTRLRAWHEAFTCTPVKPDRFVPTLEIDVRNGLLKRPRSLPPKYFYDATGSQLFDRICDTPEYYLTRTEDTLLEMFADEIIAKVRPDHIIELGSGASRKTRRLLHACQANRQVCTYWPFDVCASVLRESSEQLINTYAWLNVNALLGDYSAGLTHLPVPPGRHLYMFLGSTLGNFGTTQVNDFLSDIHQHMASRDYLLLGADRVKNKDILRAAYDDSQGVTAQFNLNVLRVLNRDVRANFDLKAYHHRVDYNADRQRIEMYLISSRVQVVEFASLEEEIELLEDEPILTEISRKFTLEELKQLLDRSGFTLESHYEPPNRYFSLLLARPL